MMTNSAPSATIPQWTLKGHVVVACNCDFGCPCNFNGRPTPGKCEGGWTWHIEQGSYGKLALSGLNFSLLVNWPAAIHEGNGEGVIVIDEKANEQQRAAVRNLLSGQAGGPWKILSTTISKTHGPEYVPFEVSFGDFTARVVAGKVIELQMEPVKNPVTGAEVHPRAVLPEGFVFKDASLGRSSVFRLNSPVSYDHSGRYAASSKYEYSGP
jgi:hypothetical protein